MRLLGVYRFYEKLLLREVKSGDIPSHVGIILDGNRRWAVKQGLSRIQGHFHGAERGEEVLNWCLQLGIKTVTMYVLSTENLQRDPLEVDSLMSIFMDYCKRAINNEELRKNRVRFKALGRLEALPKDVIKLIEALEEETKSYDKFFLNIAIAYGGRSEIIGAVKRIAQGVDSKRVRVEDIDAKLFEKNLLTAHLPNPNPDLIIRTSGEERLSNFLLWQSAYSELVFIDVYWPEIRKIDFLRAIRVFQRRKRRFGR